MCGSFQITLNQILRSVCVCTAVRAGATLTGDMRAQRVIWQLFPLMHKLTWLVLGEDPAARSHRVEQFTAF